MKCTVCGETDEEKLVATAMGIFCKKHRTMVQTFWWFNLNFEDYIKERKRIFALQPLGGGKETSNLIWASNSLGGETGEFQNIVKKIYRDYDQSINKDMKEKLISELGDIFWYWLFVCDILNLEPQNVIEYNIKKLKERYKLEWK